MALSFPMMLQTVLHLLLAWAVIGTAFALLVGPPEALMGLWFFIAGPLVWFAFFFLGLLLFVEDNGPAFRERIARPFREKPEPEPSAPPVQREPFKLPVIPEGWEQVWEGESRESDFAWNIRRTCWEPVEKPGSFAAMYVRLIRRTDAGK